jgi:hypothetical protein
VSLHLKINGWLEVDVEPIGDLSREEILDLLRQDDEVALNLYDGHNAVIECAYRGVLAHVVFRRDHIEHQVCNPDGLHEGIDGAQMLSPKYPFSTFLQRCRWAWYDGQYDE